MITTGSGDNVLQWGGAALTNKVSAPAGITANGGFSIGAGASLKIAGSASSVLVNDLTGNPSQIYGALTASGIAGPLFVANSSGVIVGSTGVISAPTAGVGLIGYSVDSPSYAGALSVNDSTAGAGSVTIQGGASITGGPLLVASNGTVNIAALSTTGANYVIAGEGFATTAGGVVPTVASALTSGSGSVVNFTASGATLTVDTLFAAGAVNNAAALTLSPGGGLSVAGLFTNSGVLSETGALGGGQLAGGLTNAGVIKELAPAGMTIATGTGTKGNFSNKGVLNLAGSGPLWISAANIDLEGQVQIGGKPLGTTNALTSGPVDGVTFHTNFSPPSTSQDSGVVDVATSLYTDNAFVAGNAIRILSGGIFATHLVDLRPGTKASAVADPFYKLKALNYTMSVFSGATVQAAFLIKIHNPFGGTSFTTSPGVNLDGTLSAPNVYITANNINGTGGIQVPNAGTINLTFYGNVNNPNGAAANSSTAFQYNGLPVTVGPNGTKAGTATINLGGPSYSSGTVQLVNLLVGGNVNLGPASGAQTPPTLPTAVQSPYTNNHLVVQATGNIGLSSSGGSTFYWPGLVYLASGISATNPTAAPNSTASISLGDSAGNVTLENLIPADLTTPDVAGQIGRGGIYFETNNLNLGPSSSGTAASVITSNDSWVHFLTPSLASAFSTVSGSSFLSGTVSGSVITTSTLPASDFVSP